MPALEDKLPWRPVCCSLSIQFFGPAPAAPDGGLQQRAIQLSNPVGLLYQPPPGPLDAIASMLPFSLFFVFFVPFFFLLFSIAR